MLRTSFRRHGSALKWAAVLLAVAASGSASAETFFQLDGAANLNYTVVTPSTDATQGVFVQLRPGVLLQVESPRLVWRFTYLFAANVGVGGSWENSYSNQVGLSLAAQLSDRSTLIVAGNAIQGGTAFQISEKPADAGTPSFHAPGNPGQVSATLGETFAWQASPDMNLVQGLTGMVVATQDALGRFNSQVTGLLRLDWARPTHAIGAEWEPSVAMLSPLTATGASYLTVTNALRALWTHDLSERWNARLAVGVAQVAALAGSYPLAIVPTGSLGGRFTGPSAGGGVDVSYGPLTNLQTGTVTQAGQATLRGFLDLERDGLSQLAGSAGFVRSRPLGQVSAALAAGLGDALQGDVGATWALSSAVIASLRYSVAYQFNQPAGLPPSLVQVFLLGFTGRYGNATYLPPVPTTGQRVDGNDAVRFPPDPPRKPKAPSP